MRSKDHSVPNTGNGHKRNTHAAVPLRCMPPSTARFCGRSGALHRCVHAHAGGCGGTCAVPSGHAWRMPIFPCWEHAAPKRRLTQWAARSVPCRAPHCGACVCCCRSRRLGVAVALRGRVAVAALQRHVRVQPPHHGAPGMLLGRACARSLHAWAWRRGGVPAARARARAGGPSWLSRAAPRRPLPPPHGRGPRPRSRRCRDPCLCGDPCRCRDPCCSAPARPAAACAAHAAHAARAPACAAPAPAIALVPAPLGHVVLVRVAVPHARADAVTHACAGTHADAGRVWRSGGCAAGAGRPRLAQRVRMCTCGVCAASRRVCG